MAQRVKQTDVSEKDVFGLMTKSAEKLIATIQKGNKVTADQAKRFKDISNQAVKNQSTLNQVAMAYKKVDKAVEKVSKNDKEILKTQKQLEKARLAELKLQKDRERAFDRFEKKRQQEIKQAQRSRKATIDGANAYKRLTKQVDNASNRFKRMSAQYGATDARTIKAKKNFDRLDASLRRINQDARDGRRDVGRYGLALKNVTGNAVRMAGMLGAGFGAFTLIRGATGVIRDFQQAQANLSAVLADATLPQLQALTDQAKELGATTKFTASEVTGLQLELGKLGFDPEQIGNMTEGVLQLASASGTELSEASAVAGATLRGFGLDATQTQRVVDVMARSFSASSLDMSKFSTAMAAVAPSAKAVGLNIEETTALIGTLTDSGIDASTAGTGLRNMFLASKKAGISFEDALEQIRNSSDKLGTSFDLFGKRGATLGVVLADNADATEVLNGKLEDAGGTAEEMAKKQLDTLQGKLDLVNSAWEGWILSLDEASGAGDGMKWILQQLADNLGDIIAVTFKLIVAFTTYKVLTSDIAKNTAKFAKSILDAGFNMGKLKEAMNGASGSANKLGGAIKAIGFTALIYVITEVITKFNDLASGASRARWQMEQFEKANKKANETAGDYLKNLKLEGEERKKAIQEKIQELLILKDKNKEDIKARQERVNTLRDQKLLRGSTQKFNEILALQERLLGDAKAEDIAYRDTIIALKNALEPTTDAQDEFNDSLDDGKKKAEDLKIPLDELNDGWEEYLANIRAIEEEGRKAFEAGAPQIQLPMVEVEGEQFLSTEESFKRILQERELALIEAGKSEEEIEEELTQLVIQHLQQRIDERKAVGEDTLELELQLAKKRKELAEMTNSELFEMLEDFGKKTLDEMISQQKEKIAVIQSEIDANKELENQLRESANSQNAIASESLASQQEATEQKIRDKEAEVRKQQVLEDIKLLYNAIERHMEDGDNIGVAGSKAFTEVFGVRKIAQVLLNIPGFLKGTKGKLGDENTAVRGGKDGHLIWADSDEMIINPEKVAKAESAGIYTTDQLVDSAVMYSQMSGSGILAKGGSVVYHNSDMSTVEKKLDTLIQLERERPNETLHPIIKNGLLVGLQHNVQRGSILEKYKNLGK